VNFLEKNMNIKKFCIKRKIYNALKNKYPHYLRFADIEKKSSYEFDDRVRNYLIELEERRYVVHKDMQGVDSIDDFQYRLTSKGLDELSIVHTLKWVGKYIILPIFISAVAYIVAKFL